MPRQKSTPAKLHQVAPLARGDERLDSADALFTLRVRHPNGVERLQVKPSQRLGEVRQLVSDLTKVALKKVLLFRDMSCTEGLDGDDDEQLGVDGLGLTHGDMITMKEKPTAPPRKKREAEGEPSAADGAKRAKPTAMSSGGEYLREGKTPRDIAIAFMTPEARLSGEAAYSQMSAAARLDAVHAGRVQLERQRKGAKATLSVTFTGNRRACTERTPCYSRDELVGVLLEILTRQTTSSRRTAASASHLLNAAEIARRSPALFWSIYALDDAGGSLDERLAHLVDLASAKLPEPRADR